MFVLLLGESDDVYVSSCSQRLESVEDGNGSCVGRERRPWLNYVHSKSLEGGKKGKEGL